MRAGGEKIYTAKQLVHIEHYACLDWDKCELVKYDEPFEIKGVSIPESKIFLDEAISIYCQGSDQSTADNEGGTSFRPTKCQRLGKPIFLDSENREIKPSLWDRFEIWLHERLGF